MHKTGLCSGPCCTLVRLSPSRTPPHCRIPNKRMARLALAARHLLRASVPSGRHRLAMHSRGLASSPPWERVAHVGESGLLLRFGTCIDMEVNKRVIACLSAFDQASPLSGVQDMLPGYASLLLQSMLSCRRVLVLASFGSGLAAGCFGVCALLQAREDCECEK